ncbi:hypothetical protein [Streptomyces sp. NPDC007856]|uniref:hypothetical protein n=1 Tax=Streptomyces sp. NPDC007856 TaxID=3364781 RepID=UPI0036A0BC82
MADDGTFVADAGQIQAGGGATGSVADHVRNISEQYTAVMRWDPQNPPWGNDAGGRQFGASFGGHVASLRQGVNALYNAVNSAADLTLNSGKKFQTAKDDALTNVTNAGGGKGSGRKGSGR